MKKYEFTEETIEIGDHTLHRVKALRDFGSVKAEDLGGFVEKEDNLSREGDAWIFDNAKIFGNAKVFGNAQVFSYARIFGNAQVFGSAKVFNYARVFGNAEVSDNARVFGYARIFGNAQVFGSAKVSVNARISSSDDYLCVKGLGSKCRNTTFFRCEDGRIYVNCGCFSGTLDEFEEKVRETHGDSKFAKEYLAFVQVVKIHFELE